MLTLQTQYQALLQEKNELERRLTDAEDWKAEAAKYSLKEVGKKAFVYAPEPDADPLTPMHWLCARCYQEKKKSILQRAGLPTLPWGDTYLCPTCQATIYARP